jgi:serine protease Do
MNRIERFTAAMSTSTSSPSAPDATPTRGRAMRGIRARRPLGLFFLAFCTVGVPVAALSTLACSTEAEASPPKGDKRPLWTNARGKKIAKGKYDPRMSLSPMLDAVLPSVVSIEARDRSGGLRGKAGGTHPSGLGSGFIIRDDGLIVTNAHVVSHHDVFRVHLKDGRVFEADVLGADPQTDVALIALRDAKDLPIAHFGKSDKLSVGDWVVAVGSPLGLEQSVTRGIVSAKGRGSLGLYADGYADFIQTDAAISPGNSGGPLFNLQGEVVGMNTAVSGIGNGLGFAVPIDQIMRVLEPLRAHGEVRRGWLGVAGREMTAAPGQAVRNGALISSVHERTPAAKAGLRDGDVVVSVDGKAVDDFDDLRGRVGEHPPGDEIRLEVERDGKKKTLRATLGERPSPRALAQYGGTPPMQSVPPQRKAPKSKAKSKSKSKSKARSKAPAPDEHPQRLGIEVQVTREGLIVRGVSRGSLGARLGLRVGDVITELNGKQVRDVDDVTRALATSPSKTSVKAKRNGGVHSGAVQTFSR